MTERQAMDLLHETAHNNNCRLDKAAEILVGSGEYSVENQNIFRAAARNFYALKALNPQGGRNK